MGEHEHTWAAHCTSPSCTWRQCQKCRRNERYPCLCGHPVLNPISRGVSVILKPGEHAHTIGMLKCSCGCPVYRRAT